MTCAFTSKDTVANTASEILMSEAMKLDKDNIINFNRYGPEAKSVEKFAKEYKAAMMSDFRSSSTEAQRKKDEKASDKFWSKYKDKTVRSGFAGSGETEYTGGGKTFVVRRSATGKGFYGSEHWIEVKEDLKEGAERWGLFFKNGQIGAASDKDPIQIFDDSTEAKEKAKRMNKILSPGEKKYYGMKYSARKLK